jgi:hypothetical protein
MLKEWEMKPNRGESQKTRAAKLAVCWNRACIRRRKEKLGC